MAQLKTTQPIGGVATDLEVPPYSMQIVWDPDDRIFVVSVPELPGCMTHGDTYEEAAAKGREAIASWLGAAEAWDTPIPPPRVERYPLEDEPAAPPVTLPESSEMWSFVQTIVRLIPDAQNLSPRLLEEFRPLVEVLNKLSPEDRAVVRRVAESEQLWLGLMEVAGRAILAHGQLTGKALPSLPMPEPDPDHG